MYEEFYNLTESPFNITPDPRYLFFSRRHREAYEHISYLYSDVFDLGFSVLGRPAQADDVRVVGELTADRSLVLCGEDGLLCGIVLINATDRLEPCRELLGRKPKLSEAAEELEEREGELEKVVG